MRMDALDMIPGPLKGLGHRRQCASSVRSAMFVAASRGVKLAPLGAACPPSPPTRAGFMPLLTELENYVVGRLGYKHGAPDGAAAPAHACQVSRPDAKSISL